jgi:hypothetical protein
MSGNLKRMKKGECPRTLLAWTMPLLPLRHPAMAESFAAVPVGHHMSLPWVPLSSEKTT